MKGQPQVPSNHPIPEGEKSYLITLLLSYLFGMFGADRFYLGKTRSAKWKLLTLGGLGYWWLIDLIVTLCGGTRDQWGLRLEGYDRHKKTVWKVLGAVLGVGLALNVVGLIGLAAFDADGLTTVGWQIVGGLGVAGVIIVGSGYLRRRRAAKTDAVAIEDQPVPPTIQGWLDRLGSLRHMYVPHAATGNGAAALVVARLESLITNVGELFRRLQGRADRAQRRIAQTEYEDKLERLTAALDRGYLLDLIANPRLWEDAEERIEAVVAALVAVDDQVLENVRQVNALKGLVFEVSVDGLLDRFTR